MKVGRLHLVHTANGRTIAGRVEIPDTAARAPPNLGGRPPANPNMLIGNPGITGCPNDERLD